MKKLDSPFILIKRSCDIFFQKENLVALARVYLPIGILSLITFLPSFIPAWKSFFDRDAVMICINLTFALTGIFVNLAGIIAIFKIVREEKVRTKKIFKEAFSIYGKFLIFFITLYLIYALGLILLIIPFVLAVTWFTFSKFIFIEKEVGIKAALTESRKLVKGRFWQILERIIIFGLFSLAAQIVLTAILFELGVVIFYLCGGLFVLPQYLLYKQLRSEAETISG